VRSDYVAGSLQSGAAWLRAGPVDSEEVGAYLSDRSNRLLAETTKRPWTTAESTARRILYVEADQSSINNICPWAKHPRQDAARTSVLHMLDCSTSQSGSRLPPSPSDALPGHWYWELGPFISSCSFCRSCVRCSVLSSRCNSSRARATMW
jgi:hypothetical protein